MQGYSRQVFQNPLAPEFIRQFAAHGQMLGVDPDTGEPIFQNIDAAATGNNVVQGTDNDMLTTPWPGGTGTSGFDIDGPHAAERPARRNSTMISGVVVNAHTKCPCTMHYDS